MYEILWSGFLFNICTHFVSLFMSTGVHGYDTIRLKIHHTLACLLFHAGVLC